MGRIGCGRSLSDAAGGSSRWDGLGALIRIFDCVVVRFAIDHFAQDDKII